jgi:micrococcal nuclease
MTIMLIPIASSRGYRKVGGPRRAWKSCGSWYTATMRRIIAVLALLLTTIPVSAEPPDADSLYFYRAVVVEVVDGDTVTADVDLGFSVWIHGERMRLARIAAPNIKGADREAGQAAGDFLRDLVLDKPLIIQTIQDSEGKDGRYIAEIWLDGENLNDRMVAEGHAVYRED